MKYIEGGVTAALGFTAAALHCGVKTSKVDKKDVMIIAAGCGCAAAGVYTKNLVKAAPVTVTMKHLEDGKCRAIIANSGNANACAPGGEENAERMCAAAAEALGIDAGDVAVASTGVIGQPLNIKVIEAGIPEIVKNLSRDGSSAAAEAIMTTDLTKKEFALTLDIGGKPVTIGGITKGSGMIHPNMGTMLCFITTDACISQKILQKALIDVTNLSFNRISVDGDTSTNDMCVMLASGLAGNDEINEENGDYKLFFDALLDICVKLAREMAADGEGATHLLTCTVEGAVSDLAAECLGKSVIASSLVKAAMFGADANWGRILCAMGYAGTPFEPGAVSISFKSDAGEIMVCENGRGLPFDEGKAKKILLEKEIIIAIKVGPGPGKATCWGCDMTYDYVRINGDYRS